MCALGADVNKATTNHDHTVLSLACAGGHIGVVELLLKHGANAMQKLKVHRIHIDSIRFFDVGPGSSRGRFFCAKQGRLLI